MNGRDSINWWTIAVLGAIDGLVVGLILDALRVLYEKRSMEIILQEASRQNKPVGYFLNPVSDLVIPGICVVAFGVISPIVYRYFRHRQQSILILWLAEGLIAVSAGYLLTASSRDLLSFLYLALFASISYLLHWIWKRRPHYQPLLWQTVGISAVLGVAAATQVIGLFTVQRFELRHPLTWLLCLLVVLVVNFIYGIVLEVMFPKHLRKIT